MTQRIYHGQFTCTDLSDALLAYFSRGNLRVNRYGTQENMVIQIATSPYATSGGTTALAVHLQTVEDGIAVEVGKQTWFGIAASLGVTTVAALSNPWNLINRLDDIAQDIEYVQLSENVWRILDSTAKSLGSGFNLSERLNKYICDYCTTPNPPGEPLCIACGAPLGDIQPRTCPNCGYVVYKNENKCINCGKPL
jgi:hypothetical protein